MTGRARVGRWCCLTCLAAVLVTGAAAVAVAVFGVQASANAEVQEAADSGIEILEERPATGNDLRAPQAHNSPDIAADPTDEDFVALANRLDNPDFSCALHVSADGGRGWVPAEPVPQLPDDAEKCYAPQVAFDVDGRLHYLFVGLAGSGNRPVGVYLTTSDDGGRSFSPPREVLGEGNYQVRMTVDRSIGKRGRLHLVWLQTRGEPSLGGLPSPPNPIVAAHSDDGGQTFSEPVRVSDPQRHQRAVAPAVTVGAEGTLYVAYYDLQDDARDYQGLDGPVWDGSWSVVAAASSDGGKTFEQSLVDDALVPPERVMLIFTMPPPAVAADDAGNVYIAWHDARNDDWDVFAAASHDDGASWQKPVRVNDDLESNAADQLLPQLSVSDGRVEALFFDRRDDDDNVEQHVYFASSTDNGETFASNVRVTRFPSRSDIGARYAVPSAAGKVEFGLGLAMLSGERETLAAWPDTRHGLPGTAQQEVFTTHVVHDPAGTQPGTAWWVATTVAGMLLVAALVWGLRRAGESNPSIHARQPAVAGR